MVTLFFDAKESKERTGCCCITFEKLILMSKSQEGGQSETVQEENDSKDI